MNILQFWAYDAAGLAGVLAYAAGYFVVFAVALGVMAWRDRRG